MRNATTCTLHTVSQDAGEVCNEDDSHERANLSEEHHRDGDKKGVMISLCLPLLLLDCVVRDKMMVSSVDHDYVLVRYCY